MLQLFEEVQRKHTHGQTNPGFETDLSDSAGSEREGADETTAEETAAEMDASLDTNSESNDSL